MYRVTSISPLGATMITDHYTRYSAGIEALARQQAGHTVICSVEVADVAQNMSAAACQHGTKNKPQWSKPRPQPVVQL